MYSYKDICWVVKHCSYKIIIYKDTDERLSTMSQGWINLYSDAWVSIIIGLSFNLCIEFTRYISTCHLIVDVYEHPYIIAILLKKYSFIFLYLSLCDKWREFQSFIKKSKYIYILQDDFTICSLSFGFSPGLSFFILNISKLSLTYTT